MITFIAKMVKSFMSNNIYRAITEHYTNITSSRRSFVVMISFWLYDYPPY